MIEVVSAVQKRTLLKENFFTDLPVASSDTCALNCWSSEKKKITIYVFIKLASS